MPSSNAQDNREEQDAAEPEGLGDNVQAEDDANAVIETIECPNCGRVFTGTYCPDCGQEADPSVSATGVVSGFFRELVDVEHGLWPTFVGLTLRPGKTLQQYLSGVRKGLISPGRYLLAAVVVFVGARQISRWIGAKPPPVVDPYMTTADGKRDAFDVSVAYVDYAEEQVPFVLYLLLAVLLAFSLWTLFRDRFNREAEALAVGSFLTGHTVFLAEGVDLALVVAGYLLIGPSSIELPALAGIVFVVAYVGFACWGCFGPGWKPAAKGALGGVWAFGEVFSIMSIAFTGITLWLLSAYPSAYYAFSPGETTIWVYLIFTGVCSVPLLLHVGVEAYYRLW